MQTEGQFDGVYFQCCQILGQWLWLMCGQVDGMRAAIPTKYGQSDCYGRKVLACR